MTIKLVTDSTCDLPVTLLKKYNISVVPISIHFGTDAFLENVTIGPDTFYQKVRREGVFPKTSQPSVGEFAQMYRQLADSPTTEIISVHIGAKLSGTFRSAQLAAAKVADTVPVHVIDSMAGSAGLGWMMAEAGELISQGKSAVEIKSLLETKREAIAIFFALDNLQFAQLSGRVGKLAGFLSSVLNIKPIISLNDGVLAANHRARSVPNALRKIIILAEEKNGNTPVNVAAIHAVAPKRAHTLLEMARAHLNIQESFIGDLSISVAVHLGPGTVGLVAYPIDRI